LKTIIHINDKLTISGGVEVYISQLQLLQRENNLISYWISISRLGKLISIKIKNENQNWIGSISELNNSPLNLLINKNQTIFHIHSISDPLLMTELFKMAPVVRSVHEPRLFCPGAGKFWRKSEKICNIKFGYHCIYHTYREGCANRHPNRLYKSYTNTLYETNEGNLNYKFIIAMSEYIKSELIKAGYSKNKIILNPYFTPLIEKTINSSQDKTKSLLFVGRLSKTKGVHYFIDAGLILLNKNINITIDIVGDGQDIDYFKSIVPKSFKEKIIFHGWKSRTDIHKMMSNCYLLVFPSIYPEAFGISGIEAMMRGKPVVGFDVGGVNTWLKDGETGFLVTSKDKESLALKIQTLITDTKLYNKFANNSRRLALEKFQPKFHLKKLKNIYNKLLKYESR